MLSPSKRRAPGLAGIACLVACLAASSSPARGDFNGNATGKKDAFGKDSMCEWGSELNPVPAVLETGQDPAVNADVAGALKQAGFSSDDGWTVNVKPLQGSFRLIDYYAWVTNQPEVSAGGQTGGGEDHGEIGGAAFAVQYNPEGTDPTGANVHWLQVAITDAPGEGGFNAGGGFHAQVDNRHSTDDPSYDGNGGPANARVLIDVPHDVCPPSCDYVAEWHFVTFIIQRDTTAKTLTLYQKGVEWGYVFGCTPVTPTPEPSTVVQMGIAGVVLLGGAAWRRRARRRGA
jgi:hypothetical protein